MQYLTIIGLSLATLTFTAGLLSDITLNSYLFAAKNVLSVASAPMACLISVLYWGLQAVSNAPIHGHLLFLQSLTLLD